MEEKLRFADIKTGEFLGRLGSGDPTPGGGAAAALESALGAALLMMVANHTIGKPRYAEFEELNLRIRDEAESLCSRLTEGMDKDAEAFGKVASAFKSRQAEAIAAASVEAAEAPLAVMEDSLRGLELAAELTGKSNAGLVSDIYVAALSFSAGMKSAGFNVEANLPAIKKADPALAGEMENRKAELLEKAERLLAVILPDK